MKKNYFLALFLIFSLNTFADENAIHPINTNVSGESVLQTTPDEYPINPYVSNEIWSAVKPYFLPYNDPMRKKLDHIFGHFRIIMGRDLLRYAGFTTKMVRDDTHPIVLGHPKIKGHLIKLYTDEQNVMDWFQWKRRIEGAKVIQDLIDKLGCGHLLTVPKKWIYPLPAEPSPPPGAFRKNFILVVEKMKILEWSPNRVKWITAITKEHLEAIYEIVEELGLNDSIHASNTTFLKDGRIAFIDTEHHHTWPIRYERLQDLLSPEMQEYLFELMQKRPPRLR